ncbi:hypothetical protein UT300002_32470 [Clostridium perfringens]
MLKKNENIDLEQILSYLYNPFKFYLQYIDFIFLIINIVDYNILYNLYLNFANIFLYKTV